jgi:choline-sulfatase
MYDDSVAVPMIMAGPGIPQGVACTEPVSLVDCFPTIVDCVGLKPHPGDRNLPGSPLLEVVTGTAPQRTIMSEYHAAGAATGVFMIRKGKFKYVHYVDMSAQLFDLESDPYERRNLADEPGYRGLVADCETALRKLVDPEAADALARKDQAAKIAELGGREAILDKGSFVYSPVPGTRPIYD